MKAFISRETLIKIIKEHTILTKGIELPENFQWFQTSDGIFSWDFVLVDRVLVDVELNSFPLNLNNDITPEQKARDLLERMEVPNAQDYTAGELVELANLFAK